MNLRPKATLTEQEVRRGLRLVIGDGLATEATDEEWSDVEIWLNERYVVGLPKMEPGNLKTINFKMLFDADGKHFPTNSNDPAGRVNKVEILRDGKLYDVPVRLGD